METIGIDLAAQDKKTAMCRIEWRSKLGYVGVPASAGEADLVGALRSGGWVAIDAPFGWPRDFVDAVSGHAARRAWPKTSPEALRYRVTDCMVRDALNVWPLSVSSDRIGVTAWRCARLLTLAREGRRPADRTGRGGIVEAYPGAALEQWKLSRRGYKTSGNAEKKRTQRANREALLRSIQARADWIRWASGARERCVDSDDALDAFLCALIARAAAVGQTIWPTTRRDWTAARAEGWIHLPREDSLERLATERRKPPPTP
jgi:hypothetical protein